MNFYINLLVAMICGGLLGYQRANTHKSIGIRSMILLIVGSYLFTNLSVTLGGDPSRIAAQVCSATGFVGAGLIFKDSSKNISNLTTAILIWTTTALGCMIAAGKLVESIVVTLIVYLILQLVTLKD